MESIYLVSVKGLFAVYALDKVPFVLEHSGAGYVCSGDSVREARPAE